VNKTLRELDRFKERGWRIRNTAGGHIALSHPKAVGRQVFTGKSPGDWRAFRNLEAQIRRIERSFENPDQPDQPDVTEVTPEVTEPVEETVVNHGNAPDVPTPAPEPDHPGTEGPPLAMSKHEPTPKMPVTAMPLLITPAKAREMLAENRGNRKLRPSRINFLKSEILEGRWFLNNDAVCFSTETPRRLLNGQHRLTAIIEANKAAMLLVVYNMDPAAFKTMDVGSKRNFHDLTGLPATLTSDASLLRILREGSRGSARMSSATQIEDVAEWWEPAYDAVMKASGGLKRAGMDSSPIRIGVGLRWAVEGGIPGYAAHQQRHRERVLAQYRLLLENDVQKLDRAIATFWQRTTKAKMSHTRELRVLLAAQTFYYFDPRRAESMPMVRDNDEAIALIRGWAERMEDAYVRAPKDAAHPYLWVDEPKIERRVNGGAAIKQAEKRAREEAAASASAATTRSARR
jgi:hypothetical protein